MKHTAKCYTKGMIGIVYIIKNIKTGDSYIGSSVKTGRPYQHFSMLNTNKHFNALFQSVWNSSSLTDWTIGYLEEGIDVELLSERETHWITRLNPSFNILKIASPRSNEPIFNSKEIYDLHNQGKTLKAISQEIGCSYSHAFRTIRRLSIADSETKQPCLELDSIGIAS